MCVCVCVCVCEVEQECRHKREMRALTSSNTPVNHKYTVLTGGSCPGLSWLTHTHTHTHNQDHKSCGTFLRNGGRGGCLPGCTCGDSERHKEEDVFCTVASYIAGKVNVKRAYTHTHTRDPSTDTRRTNCTDSFCVYQYENAPLQNISPYWSCENLLMAEDVIKSFSGVCVCVCVHVAHYSNAALQS